MAQTTFTTQEKEQLPDLQNLTIKLPGEDKYGISSCFYDQNSSDVEINFEELTQEDLKFHTPVYWEESYDKKLEIHPCPQSKPQALRAESWTQQYLNQGIILSFSGMVFPDVPSPDETKNTLGKKYADKLINLQNKIGKEKFEKLSFPQQIFMANTFGSINLGNNVNIQSIYDNTQDE